MTPPLPTHVTDGDQTPLAASRAVYRTAVRMFSVQLGVLLATAFGLPLLGLVWKDVIPYIPFLSVLAAVVDVVFERQVDDLKKQTARLHDLYDCAVLGLPWSTLAAEERPLDTEVVEAANNYKRWDPQLDRLRDWFPAAICQLPLRAGAIASQRVTSQWNRTQHQWAGVCTAALLVVFLLLITLFTFNTSLQDSIATYLAPSLPLVLMLYRHYLEHKDAVANYRRLEKYTEELWTTASAAGSEERLAAECRRVQDEFFELRCRRPIVFKWFYELLRPRLQRKSDELVARLVEGWRRTHP